MTATTLRFGLAAAFAAGSMATASQDDPKKKGKPDGGKERDPSVMFQRLDRNGDGKIDKSEMEAVPERARQFLTRADANGDGTITKEEMLGGPRGRPGKERKGEPGEPPKGRPGDGGDKKPGKFGGGEAFKRLDVNGDGKISKDEAKGPMANAFERLDADKDGFLTQEEARIAFARLAKKEGGKGERPERKKGERKRPGDAPPPKGDAPKKGEGMPEVGFMMQRLDSNGDGKIAKDEARGPMAENFDRLDRNKDGFLAKDEIEEFGNRMKQAKGMGGGLGGGQPSLVNMFNQQDADADGRVTKAEAKGKLAEDFDKLDADKDGKLSRQEVESGMKKPDEKK
jgi:Ca2+-binding EF-hand superfamily protein